MPIKYYIHNAYFLVAFNCTYPRCRHSHQEQHANGDYRCGVNVYVQYTSLKFWCMCPKFDSGLPALVDVLDLDWSSYLSAEERALLKVSSIDTEIYAQDVPFLPLIKKIFD